jgi:uncharacterized protein
MNERTSPKAAKTPPPRSAALTDAEFDRLESFLDACGPDAMNLEMLDGFLAALICGPDPVLPEEYLPEIWGEAEFSNPDEAAEMVGLVTRHWNTIETALQRALTQDEIYEAYIYEDEEGRMLGNDWAGGFLHGVGMRVDSWQELLDDVNDEGDDANEGDEAGVDENDGGREGGLLAPMLWLVHEHDEDPEQRPPAISPQKRDELLGMMVGGLTLIYRHFAPTRRTAPREPVRRTTPKVGRNEPCPCGSGRKYKLCCGKPGETLH